MSVSPKLGLVAAASGVIRPIAVSTEEEEGFRALRRRHRLTDSIRHRLSLPLGTDETRDSLLRELTFLTQEREAIEEKLRQTCRAPRYLVPSGHE